MTFRTDEQRAMDPITVRIPEAVRLTGISRSRLYELIRSGEVEVAKVGSSTLVVVESLRRMVAARSTGCASGCVRPDQPA